MHLDAVRIFPFMYDGMWL